MGYPLLQGSPAFLGSTTHASPTLVITAQAILLMVSNILSSVRSLNHVRFCDPMDGSIPGFLVDHQLPELAQTHVESVMPSNRLFLCHPLLLLPSIFSSIRVFSVESVLCIRCPKYWSFSFRNSFRIEWFDLLAVQGTLKNLL